MLCGTLGWKSCSCANDGSNLPLRSWNAAVLFPLLNQGTGFVSIKEMIPEIPTGVWSVSDDILWTVAATYESELEHKRCTVMGIDSKSLSMNEHFSDATNWGNKQCPLYEAIFGASSRPSCTKVITPDAGLPSAAGFSCQCSIQVRHSRCFLCWTSMAWCTVALCTSPFDR